MGIFSIFKNQKFVQPAYTPPENVVIAVAKIFARELTKDLLDGCMYTMYDTYEEHCFLYVEEYTLGGVEYHYGFSYLNRRGKSGLIVENNGRDMYLRDERFIACLGPYIEEECKKIMSTWPSGCCIHFSIGSMTHRETYRYRLDEKSFPGFVVHFVGKKMR